MPRHKKGTLVRSLVDMYEHGELYIVEKFDLRNRYRRWSGKRLGAHYTCKSLATGQTFSFLPTQITTRKEKTDG